MSYLYKGRISYVVSDYSPERAQSDVKIARDFNDHVLAYLKENPEADRVIMVMLEDEFD